MFRELEPFYEKARYRLKMAAARHMALVEQAARLGGGRRTRMLIFFFYGGC
ncbi:MAG: hypothetical protein Q7U60_11180 [Candidatus Methanoperedens sp.]|nr:hypothetical protein [Candidatus Methanoperedens sp.]